MKKLIAIAVAVALLLTLGSGVVAAASPKGAVKLALHARESGDLHYVVGSGDAVGWVIANTNANGRLIVQTHLDDGEADQTFDVWVKLNHPVFTAVVAQLTTNRQGKGNAHATIDISSFTGTAVNVQVVVKPTGVTAIIGYATATEPVPLKK